MKTSSMFLALLLSATLWTSSQAQLLFLRAIGGPGGGDGQFYSHHGLGVDPNGYLYVADSGNLRVQLFAPSGAYLTQWNSTGLPNGQFGGPIDVAVGPDGTIYVADGGQLDIFGPDRTFQRQWGGYLGCIAIDPTGQYLYSTLATDMYKYRISDGALIASWQYAGTSPGVQLGLGVGPSGNIYACSDGRVRRFSPNGTLLDSWAPVLSPGAVTVDAEENLYVTAGGDELQKYTSDGTLLGRIATGGATLLDVDVDANHNVYVLSQGTGQVLVFGDRPVSVHRQSWGHLKSLYR